MPANSTDYQGSIIDTIDLDSIWINDINEIQNPSVEVKSSVFAGRSMFERLRLMFGAIVLLLQGELPSAHVVDSIKTRTTASLEPCLVGYGWSPAIERQQTIGVQT
jgi:hypothetical protein